MEPEAPGFWDTSTIQTLEYLMHKMVEAGKICTSIHMNAQHAGKLLTEVNRLTLVPEAGPVQAIREWIEPVTGRLVPIILGDTPVILVVGEIRREAWTP